MNKLVIAAALATAVAVTGCANKKPAGGTTVETAPASAPPVAYVPPADTTSTPQAPATEVTPAPADTMAAAPAPAAPRSTAQRSTARRSTAANTSSSGSSRTITGRKYTVKRGDTLSEISQARYGTVKRVRDIVRANPGLDPDHIKVGQVITLP